MNANGNHAHKQNSSLGIKVRYVLVRKKNKFEKICRTFAPKNEVPLDPLPPIFFGYKNNIIFFIKGQVIRMYTFLSNVNGKFFSGRFARHTYSRPKKILLFTLLN